MVAAIGTFKFDDLEENICLLLLEEALKAPIEARFCSKELPIITNNSMNFFSATKYISLLQGGFFNWSARFSVLSGLVKLYLPCIAFFSVPKVFFFLQVLARLCAVETDV